ncbi:MAG: aldo/keto reductase [Sandaracinaceae bacterium]|nr:aldo/keto reductase [Sandaracinaceae bacterium]
MTPRSIGLGAMRLSTAPDRPSEEAALELLGAAIEAGVTLLDTAHAYGLDDGDLGANERLVGRAWREGVEIVTKVGMRRPKGRWAPDGRKKTLLAHAEASAEALGRVPDAVLLHALDPSTALETSARALREILDRGLARAVGVSNVRLGELDRLRAEAPVSIVEVAVSPFDDDAVRGGVVERCLQDGLRVLAHSPLGGPKRAPRLGRHAVLGPIATAHHASPGTIALAWLYGIHPRLVPIPGARRLETALAAARAPRIELSHEERARLDGAFAVGRLLRVASEDRRPEHPHAEVVLLMGIPGAGKSTAARRWVERGYERLSRDERGGTLKGLAEVLGERLRDGAERVVMDNTYATRAQRNLVIDTAWRHGAAVRCEHLDTPIAEAQINAVDRMLSRHGALLDPAGIAVANKTDPNIFPPQVQFRFRDAMEPPTEDEGFTHVETVPFVRAAELDHDRAGVVCDVDALDAIGATEGPVLVLAWLPGASDADVAAARARVPEAYALGVCVHPAGPPVCWCRRPLPGLVVEWMRRERVDPARSRYVGASAADATLAERLGIPYTDASR